MVPVKGGHRARAACCYCIRRRVEPQPEVKGMDRVEGRVERGIREGRLVMHDGSWHTAGRDDEGLNAETADKLLVAFPVIIRLDIALVPRQAKRGIGHLNHEEIELGVSR